MNEKTIKDAVIEAERFLARAKALLKAGNTHPALLLSEFPRESGAVRRASMDLTRALADMRKP